MTWSGYSASGIYHEIDGTGDPVLLIPGWAGSARDLHEIRDALAQNYRVISADPPGAGRSQPQPRTYTPSYLRDDARALLRLAEDVSSEPLHVVGHSDGGEYALLMAEMEPALVRSIVAWGAVGKIALPIDFLDSWATVVDDPIPALQAFSDELKDTYGVENARIMVESHADALKRIIEAGGDVSRQAAGSIECPALLIAGEHDYFAPPALVSDLADAMPRAHCIEVAKAGHAVHREQPAWLAGTITQWLADH